MRRSLALDGVRGIAILLVLVHHFFMGFTPGDSFVDSASFAFAHSGWCGVDLFFVLSGFLITGVLLEGREHPRPMRRFYLRRALRILPLYYALLIGLYVIAPLLGSGAVDEYVQDSAADAPWFWAFLTNVRLVERGDWYGRLVPDVFWSLAVEEQFYLVWPALVLFASRRVVMFVALGLCVLAPALRVVVHLTDLPLIWGHVLLPMRFDALAAGCLIQLLVRNKGSVRLAPRHLALAFVPVAGLFWLYGNLDWSDDLTGTIGLSFLTVGFAGLVLLSVEPGGYARFLESRLLVLFGKHSYALYLLHGLAGTALRYVAGPDEWLSIFGSATMAALAFTASASTLALAASVASHHLLEAPALRLRSRLSRDLLIPKAPPAGRRSPGAPGEPRVQALPRAQFKEQEVKPKA